MTDTAFNEHDRGNDGEGGAVGGGVGGTHWRRVQA